MQKTIVNLLITASLLLFVTVLGAVGFGFVIAGVHLLLAAHLPSWAAALLTGCAMLLLAILVLIVVRLARRSESREEREPHGSLTQPEAVPNQSRHEELFELAIELGRTSNFNARDATLLALIAGTVVGVSPTLRRQVLETFTGPEDWTD